MRYVSASCDREVIAGQGTIGLELLAQAPDIGTVVVPVGGGGLISGVAIAAKTLCPEIVVIGVQPEASCPMHRSFRAGRWVEVEHEPTLSEATAGGICRETFDMVRRFADDVVTVSEPEIAVAIRQLLFGEHLVAEGAGALAAAAALAGKLPRGEGPTVLVISGHNTDAHTLLTVLTEDAENPTG